MGRLTCLRRMQPDTDLPGLHFFFFCLINDELNCLSPLINPNKMSTNLIWPNYNPVSPLPPSRRGLVLLEHHNRISFPEGPLWRESLALGQNLYFTIIPPHFISPPRHLVLSLFVYSSQFKKNPFPPALWDDLSSRSETLPYAIVLLPLTVNPSLYCNNPFE